MWTGGGSPTVPLLKRSSRRAAWGSSVSGLKGFEGVIKHMAQWEYTHKEKKQKQKIKKQGLGCETMKQLKLLCVKKKEKEETKVLVSCLLFWVRVHRQEGLLSWLKQINVLLIKPHKLLVHSPPKPARLPEKPFVLAVGPRLRKVF
jgi:hypothetical protein